MIGCRVSRRPRSAAFTTVEYRRERAARRSSRRGSSSHAVQTPALTSRLNVIWFVVLPHLLLFEHCSRACCCIARHSTSRHARGAALSEGARQRSVSAEPRANKGRLGRDVRQQVCVPGGVGSTAGDSTPFISSSQFHQCLVVDLRRNRQPRAAAAESHYAESVEPRAVVRPGADLLTRAAQHLPRGWAHPHNSLLRRLVLTRGTCSRLSLQDCSVFRSKQGLLGR